MGRPRQFCPEAALDAAMRVFWARGYRATSIEQLVAATGVSRAGLYTEFGDKRALYSAVFERYQTSIVEPLTADMMAGGGLEAIRRYLSFLAEHIEAATPYWGCLACNTAVELAPDHPLADAAFERFTTRLTQALNQALNASAEDGALKNQVPELLADRLLGLIVAACTLGRAPSGRGLAARLLNGAIQGL